MSLPKTQATLRISHELSAKIDTFKEKLVIPEHAEEPTKADLIEMLILRGLEEVEAHPELLKKLVPLGGRTRG